ncbi:tryptophan synthase subunit alpha [Paenibacillus sp. 481]|uniref:tryptophan synthase subunit alpha n=1 Tax=Paenibacillus sp. 481 TaxID=2835869 RepID=UPI001E2BF308|nr:tryptophan synthase subunit alpha [Paenibacillus sp. 481]UHA72972.1 tryptophan synthase subunit alpha [Paenibacillus sp. 481]
MTLQQKQSNRIDSTFARLSNEGRSALMPFFTLGDPTLESTVALLLGMEQAGADLIELGIPYSDPLADGPVIEKASARALKNNVTIEDSFHVVREARRAGANIPYVLFTYFNPVLQYGLDPFFTAAAEADINGIIIPDLPIEESEPIRIVADRYGIHLIPLVAPTSEARIARIVEHGRGFIYCVSSLGVTGMRDSFGDEVESFLHAVRKSTSLPIAIGFGISTAAHVQRFAPHCDGVIVGSAVVRQIEAALPLLENPATSAKGVLQICDFVRQLKQD